MAALNFPSSPTLNQIYNSGDRYWTWNGTNWASVGSSGISGFSGYCGTSGFSGYCGISGFSGYSGPQGTSGFSGYCGTSGFSGYSGPQGTSGFSGYSGPQGTSGFSGYSGPQGTSGFSGYSGPQGTSGFSGYSGPQGTSGFSGYSGPQGTSGFSGYCGTSGFSGYSSTSGFSGFSGAGSSSAWIRKTSAYNAVSGDRIIGDTTGGSFTITLPGTPSTGDNVEITDGGDWYTNNLIVDGNGKNFETYNADLYLNVTGVTVQLIYDGTVWQVTATTGTSGFSGVGISGFSGYSGAAGPSTTINATDDNATTTLYPVMVAGTGNQTAKIDSGTTPLYYDASTGTLNSTIFNSTSDISLKVNVNQINNAYDILKKLNGVSFKWKLTGGDSYGVVAQQIEEILPAIVATNADGFKSVNYNAIIAFLIEAVKQSQIKIEELEALLKSK